MVLLSIYFKTDTWFYRNRVPFILFQLMYEFLHSQVLVSMCINPSSSDIVLRVYVYQSYL